MIQRHEGNSVMQESAVDVPVAREERPHAVGVHPAAARGRVGERLCCGEGPEVVAVPAAQHRVPDLQVQRPVVAAQAVGERAPLQPRQAQGVQAGAPRRAEGLEARGGGVEAQREQGGVLQQPALQRVLQRDAVARVHHGGLLLELAQVLLEGAHGPGAGGTSITSM